uniref:Pacifastin domain-containing protein n=1 Tax=Trichogramma kaykai TaxID=54128 RepID=A0ABD2XEV8_9HYME
MRAAAISWLFVTFLIISAAFNDAEELNVKCVPKTRFKFYCNTCWCSEEGITRLCTKKYCPENIFNRDGSLKAPINIHDKLKVSPFSVDDVYYYT